MLPVAMLDQRRLPRDPELEMDLVGSDTSTPRCSQFCVEAVVELYGDLLGLCGRGAGLSLAFGRSSQLSHCTEQRQLRVVIVTARPLSLSLPRDSMEKGHTRTLRNITVLRSPADRRCT